MGIVIITNTQATSNFHTTINNISTTTTPTKASTTRIFHSLLISLLTNAVNKPTQLIATVTEMEIVGSVDGYQWKPHDGDH